MASRYRSISRSALNVFKSSINKSKTRPMSSSQLPRSFPTFSRLPWEMGCVQSLLPFHSAVSSAWLTSCLGVDNSRSLSQAVSRMSSVGGWRLIRDVKDPLVQEIGQFAVCEHNKEVNTNLKFVHVVWGESLMGEGRNYRLIVTAKDGDVVNDYEAVVWEEAWKAFKKLTSFKRV